jgi:DNA-directed RNA polymerase subunit N (RpoN/RPB10)
VLGKKLVRFGRRVQPATQIRHALDMLGLWKHVERQQLRQFKDTFPA